MKNIIRPFLGCMLSASLFISCSDSTTKTETGSTDTTATTEAITSKDTASAVSSDTALQNQDAKLVFELTESMYAGIALMKDGVKKATNPAVSALAKKLVAEHTKLTKDLEVLSKKKGWPLPAGEPAADAEKRDEMGKENIAQFEKDWLAALRDRHETNIGKLEDAKPVDPDVKAAGEKGLPKIQELLGNIKKVQADYK